MTALAADTNREKRGMGRVFHFPVDGGSILYKGGLVALNAAGFAIPAADVAAQPVVGVAAEKVDNSAGADGAKTVRVDAEAEFRFAATSITQAMVGVNMEVVDDNTVDETAGAGNIVVGKLTEFISTTLGWVYVPGLTSKS